MRPLDAAHPIVFFANGLGDHILNLPAIRALAAAFDGRLKLICSESKASFLWDEVPLRKMIRTRTERVDGNREFLVEPLVTEAGDCDLFLSLTPWLSQSLKDLSRSLNPRISVGFWEWFDVFLPLDFSKHSSELAFDLVRYVAPESRWDRFAGPLTYPAHARRVAQSVRETVYPRRVMVLHMDTLSEKMWPTEKFACVLRIFLQNHPDFVVLLIGIKDCGIEDHISSSRFISLLGLDLASTWCIMSIADLFLGVDSCFLHAADFARVPSVGMFGPTTHTEFGFKLAPNITIQARKRMDDIQVDQVLSALESIITMPSHSRVFTA